MARRDMRLVEVITMTNLARETVLTVLEERNLDHTISDHTDDPRTSATISFPVPAHSVEPLQKQFDESGIREEIYTIVLEPETVTSDRFGDSDDLYELVEGLGHQGVSRSELHSEAADFTPDLVIYSLMVAISAVVATAGVMLQSTAVLVGAMVIAPLIGPPMATSVATVIDDQQLFVRSVKFQAIGVMVAVVSATGFALVVKSTQFTPSNIDIAAILELSTHTAPAFLLVVIALSAGFAGAISISTNATVGLVGVMISAALIPPIGIVGVGIAWGRLTAVLGSAAVVLVNVLSINLSAIICLWYLGYHPQNWTDLRKARSTMLKRVIILAVLLVVLLSFLSHLAADTLDVIIELINSDIT